MGQNIWQGVSIIGIACERQSSNDNTTGLGYGHRCLGAVFIFCVLPLKDTSSRLAMVRHGAMTLVNSLVSADKVIFFLHKSVCLFQHDIFSGLDN